MDGPVLQGVGQRLHLTAGRRALLAALSGASIAGAAVPADDLAARNRRKKRKRKKVTFCQDGQTVKTRNKQKQQRLRKRGAARGACPLCTDLQPTDDLAAAIAAAAPGATLRLCPGTFRLTSTLVADQELTIIGAGMDQTILDGGDAVTVLQIGAVDTVTVQDLTITRGRAAVSADRGGGILNEGSLTLRGVAVTACSASLGGGIFNRIATLGLEAGSEVRGNSAANTGGGIFTQGGALTLAATSSVTANSAASGGGIFIQATATTLESGSTVSGNSATNGAGVFLQSGSLTLRAGSSVTGNTAAGAAGGIFLQSGALTQEPGSDVSGNLPDNCQPDQGPCI